MYLPELPLWTPTKGTQGQQRRLPKACIVIQWVGVRVCV